MDPLFINYVAGLHLLKGGTVELSMKLEMHLDYIAKLPQLVLFAEYRHHYIPNSVTTNVIQSNGSSSSNTSISRSSPSPRADFHLLLALALALVLVLVVLSLTSPAGE